MASLLVIEDHPLFVQSLVCLLRDRGKYDVTAVVSSEAARAELQHASFDAILVDISLPGEDGIQLVDEFHQTSPGVPCLMVSGHNESHLVHQSMAAGARGYVLKEDINGILEGVKQVLHGGTFISRDLRSP